jgi:anion-transporting  ArsA/GET3 family ATPase
MKLQELAQPKATKQIAKVFESYFGNHMAFDRLDISQTRTMLNRVRGLVQEHRGTTQRHFSEQNPAYLKLVMMEQALASHLQEMTPPTPAPAAPNAQAKPAVDPAKLKAAQDKLAKGQKITPEEQTLVNASVMAQQAQTESRLLRALRTLKESEVQQAQVVLAAQDMVDSMQGMIEDATEMQYKELPALVSSIRDQVGVDQSQQFNTDATAALTTLVQSLQTAKQQLETALGVVTGQPAAPAAGMPGEMPGAEMPAAPAADMAGGAMPPAEIPAEPEAPAGTAGALGRERR